MTPLIDQVCLAAGRHGVVEIRNRRICMYRGPDYDERLVDFENFDDKCEWTTAIHELARRERYRVSP